MDIYQTFTLNFKKVKVFIDNQICFWDSAGLCLMDLETQKRRYIWSSECGFIDFDCNSRIGVIAIVEFNFPPKINIYNNNLNWIKTIKEDCEIDLKKILYSFNSQKLFLINGSMNNYLSIFDTDTCKKLNHSYYEIKEDFIDLYSNPLNEDQLLLLKKKKIYIIDIELIFIDEDNNKNFEIKEREIDFKFDEKYEDLTYLLFNLNDNLYVTTDGGNIYHLKLNGEILSITNLDFKINKLILTQKYLLVLSEKRYIDFILINEDGLIKNKKSIKSEFFENFSIDDYFFDSNFQNLILHTNNNEIIKYCYSAEKYYEEELENNNENLKQYEIDLKIIYNSHKNHILIFDEIKNTNKAISVGKDGKIFIWDIEKRIKIFDITYNSNFTSVFFYKEDNLLFIGTAEGCLRVYAIIKEDEDLKINLINIRKISKDIPIEKLFIKNGYGVLKLEKENYIIIFKINENFDFLGKINLYQDIFDFVINPSNNNILEVIIILEYGNLTLIEITNENLNKKIIDIDENNFNHYVKRVDPDLNKLFVNINQNIILVGEDRIFKEYKKPKELFNRTEKRLIEPEDPLNEFEAQDLFITYINNDDNNNLLTCGNDGFIQIRNYENIKNYKTFKCMNYSKGGASYVSLFKRYNLILIGGFDGSLLIYNYTKDNLNFINEEEKNINLKFKEMNLTYENDNIKFYEEILEKIYLESIKKEKDKIREDLFLKFNSIQEKWYILLKKNKEAEEIEKISRDEFCIDFNLKENILNEGKVKIKEIEQEAEKNNLYEEIIYKKLLYKTWYKMEVPLKTIVGIKQNILLFNFHIQKDNPKNQKYYKYIKVLRKMELKEREWQKENSIDEIFNLGNICKNSKNIFINAKNEKSKMILIDYEKRDDEIRLYEEEQLNKLINNNNQGGLLKNKLLEFKERRKKRNKKRIANNYVQNKNNEDNNENNEEDDDNNQNIKNKFSINEKDRSNEEWNYLYLPLELFPRNHKKNQIIFLKRIIKNIKLEFNKLFESLKNLRSNQLDLINEKIQKINEINEELNKEKEVFEPLKNIIEDPSNLLKIKNEEVGIEKYITKEERKKIEEEKLAEIKRLEEYSKDDAALRALKQMMNNTLEEKKENPLEEELVKEEWMEKPRENMNEEEKIKFDEFLAKKSKLEEEKEKIRKALEQESRKIKQEIKEIIEVFDKKLFILFMKRLEYEYRIYEQEIYIINLANSIYDFKNNIELKEKFKNNLNKFKEKKEKLNDYMNNLKNKQKNLEEEEKKKNPELNDKLNLKQIIPTLGYLFDTKKELINEKLFENIKEINPDLRNMLNEVDPYYDIVCKHIKEVSQYNSNNYRKIVIPNISKARMGDNEQAYIENIMKIFQKYLNYRKRLKENEKNIYFLKKNEDNLNSKLIDIDLNISKNEENISNLEETIAQNYSNIEVMIRLPNIIIEIPMKNPIPILQDAVLLNKKEINNKNREIKTLGKEKIEALKKNIEDKNEVENKIFEVKLLELKIENLIIESSSVTRLKVTKELQKALSRKDKKSKKDDEERLKNQNNELLNNTNKRIENINKKELMNKKEIESLIQQNELLKSQGATLKETVQERQEIFNMMFSKKDQDKLNDNKNDRKIGSFKKDEVAYKNAKEIAKNRKLMDLAKKYAQEIEMLMEELKKLKAKTYPNLPNIEEEEINNED